MFCVQSFLGCSLGCRISICESHGLVTGCPSVAHSKQYIHTFFSYCSIKGCCFCSLTKLCLLERSCCFPFPFWNPSLGNRPFQENFKCKPTHLIKESKLHTVNCIHVFLSGVAICTLNVPLGGISAAHMRGSMSLLISCISTALWIRWLLWF